MLELLQSNKMSALVDTLVARYQGQARDPFDTTTVVVQSFGIGQWLKVRLAEQLGIAANIECILPAELIWRLYQIVLPEIERTESPYSRELLTWRILGTLPGLSAPVYAPLQQYLSEEGDGIYRRYQLSEAIAGLFDQYLIYRPDWIQSWEQGETSYQHPWQGELWRELQTHSGLSDIPHRAQMHGMFLNRLRELSEGEAPQTLEGLPARISVLGISTLPAMHMETLHGIARLIDVDLYFLNPCQHYWGDIVSEKDQARRSLRTLAGKTDEPLLDEDYLEAGNPILAANGKQGREFLELLLETPDLSEQEYFHEAPETSALAHLKNDILNLEPGTTYSPSDSASDSPSASDLSIAIHSVHSRQREIEVLLDQTLLRIKTEETQATRLSDGSISPSDIIVMAPDIGIYAPHIQSVFKDKIRFSITDRPVSEESLLLSALFKLLGLPDSRITAPEVMDLLEVPAISRKLGLDETGLSRILRWVDQAGIRWELSAASKQEYWQLPREDQNTWDFGLRRLLLGHAFHEDVALYDDIAPLSTSSADAPLIGKLCHFLDLIAETRKALATERTAEDWFDLVNHTLAEYFLPSRDEEVLVAQVRDTMLKLVDQNQAGDYDGPISGQLLRHWLQQELDEQLQNRGFISGGVTFATLVPMRSIPYKVVCLIGMNDGDFPREEKPLSFDLMAEHYRKGDRSRRQDDRYLFLEAILSAEHYLYISYIGRSLKDNKEKPPSVAVAELKEYLLASQGSDCVTEHPLQPFNPDYFRPESSLVSFSQDWYTALLKQELPPGFAESPLPQDQDLELHRLSQLSDFYRHPARYFFRQRLGVWFAEDDTGLKETESFELDSLEKYGMAEEALSIMLQGEPLDAWQEQQVAQGSVLPGDLGERQLGNELKRANLIHEALTQITVNTVADIQQFSLDMGVANLECAIPLYDGKHLDFRIGRLRQRQKLDAWIRHLALCISGYDQSTLMIFQKGSGTSPSVGQESFSPVPPDQAREYLSTLIEFYQSGLSSPLPFLPETSWSYVSALHKGEPESKARERAWNIFNDDNVGSEGTDPNYRRLYNFPDSYTEAFTQVAHGVYNPILEFNS